ncbi:regulatory protein RecX [Streptococcus porcinus]|uniref:recombination regulator RecX n=1 Tax=Streptococcus porcinus TaxID=1340 RepID=UPI0010CAB09C|nr:recombination regulator RecX [Streptococcus porcinus]VTS18202.1 regulatory protein RecX [Streptococcus porcinus]
MKISKIEKKKRLYLLELDHSEKLYVTEDTIVKFMLSKDMEISREQLNEIKVFAQFSHGKNLALYYISFQVRTKKQVIDYLYKNEIDKITIDQIINDLEENNWINDTKYIEAYLRQNILSGDRGPHVLKQKLLQKGISPSLIDQHLTNYDYSPLVEKLVKKLLSKYQGKLPEKALKDKITQSIITKGFSYDLAKSALGHLELEQDQELSNHLLTKELTKQHRKFSKKWDGYELRQRLFQALYRKGFDSDAINQALREYL